MASNSFIAVVAGFGESARFTDARPARPETSPGRCFVMKEFAVVRLLAPYCPAS